MEYIRLEHSDLDVSRICIGGDPMGGHGWGNVSEASLKEAVRFAVDKGINFFDTADVYGLGEAERILGEALGKRRSEVVISSKFGVRRNEDNTKTFYDNSPTWIKKALEGSLRRLNTDYIDVYQLHYRDGVTPIEDIVGTLDELKTKGYIRYYGLSNIYIDDIKDLLPFADKFVSFQDQYSLAYREHESDIFEISSSLCVNPLTWGSLGQGILTGKYNKDVKFDRNDRRSREVYKNFHGEKLLKNLDIVDYMRTIAPTYDKSLAAIAIRFILDYIKNSAVIVGVKSKEQVQSNCEACGWKITDEHIKALCDLSRD